MDNLDAWKYFRIYYSSTYTQQFLKKCYQNFENGEKLSYQNSYTLIYFIEHGKKYYDQSLIAPYELQPILLFYGMIQLMKAAILTVDPYYPETTQVLAHGVSTRKRKKSQYEFFQDEVKVQKNGLLTYFAEKMFHIKHLEGEKFKMGDLMKRIPELHSYFYSISEDKLSYPFTSMNKLTFTTSNKILDTLNLSEDGIINFLREHSININTCSNEKGQLLFTCLKAQCPLISSPLQYDFANQQFFLPANRNLYNFFPELLTHYLLLYNLSMVCRYETEWWGELFHSFSSNDLPFICDFLEFTKQKVPYYISLLFKNNPSCKKS